MHSVKWPLALTRSGQDAIEHKVKPSYLAAFLAVGGGSQGAADHLTLVVAVAVGLAAAVFAMRPHDVETRRGLRQRHRPPG